tara:strand:- start:35 stop:187 length:153 start_codon:yes stop_codon:yes gene_type:complete
LKHTEDNPEWAQKTFIHYRMVMFLMLIQKDILDLLNKFKKVFGDSLKLSP